MTTPETLYPASAAMKVRGCKSRTTLHNDIKGGNFPPPDAIINGRNYWTESRLARWQEEQQSMKAGLRFP